MPGNSFEESIAQGTVYDLGQPYYPEMPHHPLHVPFLFSAVRVHGDMVLSGDVSASSEVFVMGTHVGTHIDSLAHISHEGRLFGGVTASEVQTKERGLGELGIDTVPPLVSRGVLLDVAGQKGLDVLSPGQEITPDDMEAALAAAATGVSPGDAVLIRTGWSRYFSDPQRYQSVEAGVPGLGLAAAQWLVEKGVYVAGSDTPTFEKQPSEGLPVHVFLLVEQGVYVVESMNLESLAQASVSSFTFLVIPLKIVGASASPVRPIAIG